MTDRNKAIERITDFLENKNKRILLFKGHDDDAKMNVVLNCLNKKFKQGFLRASSIGGIPGLVNSAFTKKYLPNTVTTTTNYSIGKMRINMSSYANAWSNPRGNSQTFTLYPVQHVLNDSKRYSAFLEDIKNSDSAKIILSTVNDWSINNWDIESYVDQVIFYSVENDNPQLMKTMRANEII